MAERARVGSGAPWEASVGYSRAVRVGHHVVVAGTTATAPDARATAREVSAAIDAFLSDLGRVEAPGNPDPTPVRTPPTTSTAPDVAPKASPVRATAAVLMTGGTDDGWDAF